MEKLALAVSLGSLAIGYLYVRRQQQRRMLEDMRRSETASPPPSILAGRSSNSLISIFRAALPVTVALLPGAVAWPLVGRWPIGAAHLAVAVGFPLYMWFLAGRGAPLDEDEA